MARLSDPVTILKGVGPTKAKQFAALNIHTLEDLICHYPRAYQNRANVRTVEDFDPDGPCSYCLTVATAPRVHLIRRGMSVLRFRAFDETGNCEITFRSGMKTGHRAVVAIAILEKYWNLGIGSAFFTEMIEAAKASDGIEIVELDFIEGNSRARALYEKFGFRITGMIPNAIKLRDGSCKHEYQMQLILPKKS